MAEQYRFLFEEFELKKVDFDVTESTLDFVVDTEKIQDDFYRMQLRISVYGHKEQ